MARVLFLIFVFANLVFFVWSANYLGGEPPGHEPYRLKQQVAPEKMAVFAQNAALPEQVCRRVGPMAAADADRLKNALEARGGVKVEPGPVEETSYWVFIPPQPDKAAADKKGAELKELGVSDFFIVTEQGPSRYAISLGSFHDEATAREYFDQLSKKGVRSARVDLRTRPVDQMQIDVRGPADVVEKGLATLAPASAPIVDCPAS